MSRVRPALLVLSALLAAASLRAGPGGGEADGRFRLPPAVAHFGLGKVGRVDVEVVLPYGNGTLTRSDVRGEQRLVLGVGGGKQP